MILSSPAIRAVLSAASVLFLTAGLTSADFGDEFAVLFASNGSLGDKFGDAVACSETTLIVGARHDDENGISAGVVYLFDTTTELQTAKLLASDGAAGDAFGSSVGISGTTAIVGAFGNDEHGSESGAAYLFDTTTGMQTAKLVAYDATAFDFFGISVAISGTTAIVGAPFDDDNGSGSGSVYVFDTITGLQVGKLLANDGVAGDSFGYSVAISGTTAIIGAHKREDNGDDSGCVYLFDTTTGTQLMKLLPSDGDIDDEFGRNVAISGTTAIVSSEGDDDVFINSGAAYVFDTATGSQLAKLTASDVSKFNGFGDSVAISETTVVIGARFDDENGTDSGAAYVFDTTTGSLVTKLFASNGGVGDVLGESVAISGSTVFVGATGDDGLSINTGTVFLFNVNLPALSSDVQSLSIIAGGSQVLTIEAGVEHAGSFYFMLGSASGTNAGFDFGDGNVLPLNHDAYFDLTLRNPGLGIFENFRGVLDANGKAAATFVLPPTGNISLVGVELHHALVLADVFGIVDSTSDAVPVLLVP